MLEYIRSNAQSWGVKIAFAVIILVFVFWGVGNMSDSGPSGVVATVNGKAILQQDFGVAYRNVEENIRMRNPAVTSDQLRAMRIGQQVLQQLVMDSLMQEEATRTGLVVTPVELRRTIEIMPIFHNAAGSFDPAVYKRVLEAQRNSPGRFEDGIRRSLLEQKLREQVTAAAYVLPSESRALFDFTREQRVVEYVFFPAADYLNNTPGEDEIKAYYESNRASFVIPAKVKIEYIEASPEALVDPASVPAAAVKAAYEKNISSYAVPAKVDVRHILLRVDEKAPQAEVDKVEARIKALAAAVKKSGDFAAVAKKSSEDSSTAPQGGQLGPIAQGDTVAPFEEAAFALQAGQVSAPVRTQFGFHLIKANSHEAAHTKTLAEVEGEIRKQLAAVQGMDHVREVLDALIEGNILGKPLAELAKAHKLEAKSTELLSAPQVRAQLKLNEKAANVLMATPAKSPVDTALEAADNAFVVARVLESVPAGTQEFSLVREEIVQKLRADNAQKSALEAAAKVRKDMGTAVDAALPASLNAKIKASTPFGRGEGVPGLGQHPEVAPAIFAASVGQWLPSAFPVSGAEVNGAALVRVQKVLDSKDEEWQALQAVLGNSLETGRKNEVFRLFLMSLGLQAKVEVKNTSLIEGEGLR